jgi:hypothetical protein
MRGCRYKTYLAILNKQAQIMLMAGAELGFSPASRTRVQVANERASPFAWLNDPDDLTARPCGFRGLEETSPTDKFFDDRGWDRLVTTAVELAASAVPTKRGAMLRLGR